MGVADGMVAGTEPGGGTVACGAGEATAPDDVADPSGVPVVRTGGFITLPGPALPAPDVVEPTTSWCVVPLTMS